MRLTRSILLGLALFAGSIGHSGSRLAARPVKGLFWKATSGTRTLYLLGSIHVGDSRMYPLPKEIEGAFERSAALVVESYSPNDSQADVDAFMDKHGVYPEGESLFRHLSSGTEDKLRQFASKNGVDATNLGSLKPWVVMMVTGFWPMISGGKTPSAPGIDDYFIGKAKDHKPIVGVETTEFQLNQLASIPDESQIAILTDALASSSTGEPDLEELWAAGNAAKIEKVTTGSFAKYPAIRKRLLEERNSHMVAVALSTLSSKNPCFLVVGAAHMLGPDGIVNLLRRKGFQVSAVHPG